MMTYEQLRDECEDMLRKIRQTCREIEEDVAAYDSGNFGPKVRFPSLESIARQGREIADAVDEMDQAQSCPPTDDQPTKVAAPAALEIKPATMYRMKVNGRETTVRTMYRDTNGEWQCLNIKTNRWVKAFPDRFIRLANQMNGGA